MIKCLGYILYSSAAHATVRVFMSWIPSPQPLLHPQSSQYWALTASQSLSGCTHRQNTNQLRKLNALHPLGVHTFFLSRLLFGQTGSHKFAVSRRKPRYIDNRAETTEGSSSS